MKYLLFFFLLVYTSLFISGGSHPESNPVMQPPDTVFSFVFMTDIHLQPEKNAVEGFRKAISRVNDLEPDFVITGGDLVMDVLGQSFGRADTLFKLYTSESKGFKMPVYNTMGNHENFAWYKRNPADTNNPEYGKKMFEKRIGKRFYSFDHKGWHFIILDSVEKDLKEGYIGGIDEEQIKWLQDDLSKVDPGTPIVLAVHIPFITVMGQLLNGSLYANEPSLVITNSKPVLDLFKGRNLKLVLQGHLHYYEDIFAFNTHYVTGGSVAGAWWEGSYLGTKEGFLQVKITGRKFVSEYLNYGWKAVGGIK
jgi:Icc protein